MVKTLSRHGNSLALVFDRGILDLMNVDAKTPLEISTDGRILIIAPLNGGKRREKVLATYSKVNKTYSKLFERLAG
jgi:antitoxin component of MazEF toxin-antitoxin module